MHVVLGVSGGIAAYKAVLLLRLLREAGHDVRVIPTDAALRFVGAPTWEALSGHAVTTSVFEGTESVDHVRFGREAELVIVAPATADLLARAATGQADDLLTATLLTASCPVVMAPAMHTEMWHHPATVANVATLRERGVTVLEPDDGRLTGTDSGPGRLLDPEAIAAAALALVAPRGPRTGSLAGVRVVISAGGTREPLDPVRFLGNRSSGRQGIALARVAAERGADVELVAANVEPALLPTSGITVTAVETTADLHHVMTDRARTADVLIMAAAVADFRPARAEGTKIKKRADKTMIELVQSPDILRQLATSATDGQVVVGFAAETGDDSGGVLEHGRDKARRKGADLLAVNHVGNGRGFGDVPNAVVILDATGAEVATAEGSKDDVAAGLWDAITTVRNGRALVSGGDGHPNGHPAPDCTILR